MKKISIFSGIVAISLTSAALYAAPGMKQDADNNGSVTKAEALAAADAQFAKMDANGDGSLNEADKAAMVKKHFARMDADKNGSVSEAEFVVAHEARAAKGEGRGEKRMGRGGRDGKMGRLGGGMRMMSRADTNGDKAISQTEFRAMAETRFARADANGDGTISADEQRSGRKGKRGKRPDAAPAPADAG